MGKIIIGSVMSVLLIVGGVLLIPTPSTWEGTWAGFHIPFVLDSIMACLYLGAALLFVTTLKAYKQTMRRAFLIIACGMVLTALGTLQLPIMDGFDLWDSPWATNGGAALPFLFGSFALYMGIRKYGKLVGTTTLLTRVALMIPAVILGAFAFALMPHAAVPSEVAYDISSGVLMWSALFDLIAVGIIWQVRRHVGEHYKQALIWLAIAIFATALCLIINLIQDLLSPNQDGVGYIVSVGAVISGFMWMRAGYTFMQTRSY